MDVAVIHDALRLTVDRRSARMPLGALLTEQLWLPAGFVRQLFSAGRVRTGAGRATFDQVVPGGGRVWLQGGVREQEIRFDAAAARLPAAVLYEDGHALVVDKPPGVLVYPGTEADHDTLAHRVAEHYARTGQVCRVRHVHRLDRDTTGAVLYAKHEYAARTFDALLAAHRIDRRYLALVHGRLAPATGVIDRPIGRDRHMAGRFRVAPTGKPARTRYRVLGTSPGQDGVVSLLECSLESGRTHQIRVHLADTGCPVVGDRLYGASAAPADKAGGRPTEPAGHDAVGHALHAWLLALPQPYLGRPVRTVAPLPDAFAKRLARSGLTRVWEELLAAQGEA